MTLLQLVQQAAGEMGLTQPSLVIGSPDKQVKQFLALINGVGQEVTRMYPWQALQKAYLFTVVATSLVGNTVIGSSTVTVTSSAGIDATYQISGTGLNQATYVTAAPTGTTLTLSQPATSTNTGVTFTLGKSKFSLPSDFDRAINSTHWDKTKHWMMLGPETPQQWEWLISGYISTGPRIRYRVFGNYFQIWPIVSNGETLGFEYVGNAWASSAAGVSATSFAADTDTCIFNDRLMVSALKLKFYEAKGFDTTAYFRDYQLQLNLAKAEDGQAPDLSMAPRAANVLIGWENIPDSGYGT